MRQAFVSQDPPRLQEAAGLLWVWPEASKAAWVHSAAAPLPVCNAAKEGPNAKKLASGWFTRDLPYSFDVLMENLADPAHLPFSHHNLMPVLNRCAQRMWAARGSIQSHRCTCGF